MHLPDQEFISNLPVNWFDIVLIFWLFVGLLRGRKHGMSQELMLVFQWLLIVVICSHAYVPLARQLEQNSPLQLLWCNLAVYIALAMIIRSVLLKIKNTLGDRLVGSDIFGGGEYYLGMLAGVLRFACIALVFMALMNARIITKAELEATERMQRTNFESVRFPTFGTVQQGVLFKSWTGKFVKQNLKEFLIASSVPEPKPIIANNSPAKKEQKMLDEVLGPSPAKK
jgi:uncharacterized membrane protein required for colicin V production